MEDSPGDLLYSSSNIIVAKSTFSIDCQRCERLTKYLLESKQKYPNYYCKPVPAFGDPYARLIIVGLAPGLHGANATARPFTGDHAGLILYQTLYKFGFSSHAESVSMDDGLKLINARITNAVKCVPPQNKPIGVEIKNCNLYLQEELSALKESHVLLALGRIAHESILKALNIRLKSFPFAHAAEHQLNEHLLLIDSYHCSRYNTQTRRLTVEQFEAIFAKINIILNSQ